MYYVLCIMFSLITTLDMKQTRLFLLLFLLPLLAFSQDKVERIEPPFWWTGMKNQNLQLLVHGKGIGEWRPVISHQGVSLQQIRKVDSPNYIFLDLVISEEARPGKVAINFMDGNRVVESHEYELKRRQWRAGEIKGFDNSDVLYLITPDRFGNGDASNDSVDGLLETVDRSNKGGRHGGDIVGVAFIFSQIIHQPATKVSSQNSIDKLEGRIIWMGAFKQGKAPADSGLQSLFLFNK